MIDLFSSLNHSEATRDGWGLPTFLVIGAHRSGSTSLYYELAQHSQVFMAPVKETNFFAVANGETDLALTQAASERMLERSITSAEEYARLFAGSTSAVAVGEVSPSYMYSRQAATRIKGSLPDARLVVILRDPVDRAYSAFTRRNTEDKSPDAFLETVHREASMRARGEPADRLTLIDGSLYGHHLSEYLRLFDREQVHIELYERLWSEAAGGRTKLYSFLGLEVPAASPSVRYNQSGAPKSEQIDRFVRGAPKLKSFVKKNLPRRLVRRAGQARQAIERWNINRPDALPKEVRSSLMDRYLNDDVSELGRLTGLDLSIWLDPQPEKPGSHS